jgi:hypothetical protein
MRVSCGCPREGRQLQLARIDGTRSWPSHPNTRTAKYHSAARAASTHCLPVRIRHALGSTQRATIGFHHRGQRMQFYQALVKTHRIPLE